MKDWTSIQSFDRLHQAELCRNILEKNDIASVIINEKDSLFLIGAIELYVQNEDSKKAEAMLHEFKGLTKINSFISLAPIENLYQILLTENIEAQIIRKENNTYVLDNYELYVKNEDLDKSIPFLKGDKLHGWTQLETCQRVSQTKFRVDLLAENEIETIVIKKKDSEFHLEEVNIYVEKEQEQKAQKILKELNGWIKISQFSKFYWAHIREDLLKRNNIQAIIRKEGEVYLLYVEADKEELSIDLINKNKEWIKIATFENFFEADFFKTILEESEIDAVVINEKDSSFLLGETNLFVIERMVEKATILINEYTETEEIEE